MTHTYDNPIALLRQLKGAPLSVLLALSILRQPTSEQMLSRVTGYSEKVIRDAAHYLQEISLVGRNARFSGWVILQDVFQLPLMPGDSGQLDPASDCHQAADRYLLPVEDTTITTLNGRENEFVFSSRRNINESSGNYYRSNPDHPDYPGNSDHSDQLSIYQQNCLSLLDYHFIGFPKNRKIISLPYVTITYLLGHISERARQLRYSKDHDIPCKFSVGLLIYKIENHDRQPKTLIEDYDHIRGDAPDRLEQLELKAHQVILNWDHIFDEPYADFVC